MKRYARVDSQGRPINVGDQVRVIGVPDRQFLAQSSVAVFRRLVGTYRRVRGFNSMGLAEITFRIRSGPHAGIHWVWLEPHFLRLRQVRAAPNHSLQRTRHARLRRADVARR